MAVLTMIQLRPYVFGFLIAFLFLAIRHWGVARTVLWLAVGYGIAWASEALSIRTGFPYGWYFYKYENLSRDILVMGVPLWDSLSYTFLIFAGYSVVRFRWPRISPATAAAAGAIATMLLDIMIDPVSNLGDRWFLGSIYYYPTGGWHFGVPVSNYIGWGFVGWLVISVFQRIECHMSTVLKRPWNASYAAFYLAIGIFNTAIAFWIGAPAIGIANTAMLLGIAVVLYKKPKPVLVAALLFSIFVSPVSHADTKMPEFKDGDLIFLDLDCGKLCDAIEDSTLKQFNVTEPRLSHVGILHKVRTHWMVVEAWDSVQDTPLDTVLSRTNGHWYWGRVDVSEKIRKAAVTAALQRLGQPYDADFRKDNGSFYCSELVADSYNQAANETLFDYRPMEFAGIKTWTDYFAQRHEKVPQGSPGVSPLGIYLSPHVTPHTY